MMEKLILYTSTVLGSERQAGCCYLCSTVQLKDKSRGIIPYLDTLCQEYKTFHKTSQFFESSFTIFIFNKIQITQRVYSAC